jgi:hypothetical protein
VNTETLPQTGQVLTPPQGSTAGHLVRRVVVPLVAGAVIGGAAFTTAVSVADQLQPDMSYGSASDTDADGLGR